MTGMFCLKPLVPPGSAATSSTVSGSSKTRNRKGCLLQALGDSPATVKALSNKSRGTAFCSNQRTDRRLMASFFNCS